LVRIKSADAINRNFHAIDAFESCRHKSNEHRPAAAVLIRVDDGVAADPDGARVDFLRALSCVIFHATTSDFVDRAQNGCYSDMSRPIG